MILETIKKIFRWIPFLWKLDDGSYESLYLVNMKQMDDMEREFLKFSDVYKAGIDFCFQMEEVRIYLEKALEEKDLEMAQRYVNRAFEVIKQESMEWWI